MLHLALHFLVPMALSLLFFRRNWKTACLLMMATMLVDVDHLLATPVYDSTRCSIGFHPLHRLGFIAAYSVLCLFPASRIVGIGLLVHMSLDAVDCQANAGVWIYQ